MAYRNGTYVAFAADGGTDITKSDIRYYNMLKAWNLMKNRDFKMINSHEKGSRLRSWSQDETIKRTLRDRLDNSSRMLLLVSDRTRLDDDFVPYEIKYAIDNCKIPIIVSYISYKSRITNSIPQNLYNLLPNVLKDRLNNNTAKTVHIPFRERILNEAIKQFSHSEMPQYTTTMYLDWFYDSIYGEGNI